MARRSAFTLPSPIVRDVERSAGGAGTTPCRVLVLWKMAGPGGLARTRAFTLLSPIVRDVGRSAGGGDDACRVLVLWKMAGPGGPARTRAFTLASPIVRDVERSAGGGDDALSGFGALENGRTRGSGANESVHASLANRSGCGAIRRGRGRRPVGFWCSGKWPDQGVRRERERSRYPRQSFGMWAIRRGRGRRPVGFWCSGKWPDQGVRRSR